MKRESVYYLYMYVYVYIWKEYRERDLGRIGLGFR